MREINLSIKFEFKKIFKKKFVYILLLLAFLFSYKVIYNRDGCETLTKNFRTGSTYIEFLSVDYFEDPNMPLKGYDGLNKREEYDSLCELLENSTNGFNTFPSSTFIDSYIKYVEKYDVNLPEDLLIDLNYQYYGSLYLEEKGIDLEKEYNREDNYLIEYFKEASDFIFGDIILILIFIFVILINSEEFENGAFVFQRIQPINKNRLIIGKFIGYFLLLLLYILSLIIFTFILGKIKGIKSTLFFDFPLLVIGDEFKIISLFTFFIEIFLSFIYRAMILIPIGFLLSSIFKSRLKSIISGFFVIFIFWIIKEIDGNNIFKEFGFYYSSFFNPLSWNYEVIFLGKTYFLNGYNLYPFGHFPSQITKFKSLVLLLILISIYILTFYLYEKNFTFNFAFKKLINIKKDSLLVNELYKERKEQSAILAFILIFIFVFIYAFQWQLNFDYNFEKNIYNPIDQELSERFIEEVKAFDESQDLSLEINHFRARENMLKNYKDKNGKEFYLNYKNIEEYESIKKANLSLGMNFYTGDYTLKTQDLSEFSKDVLKEKQKWILENNIRPLSFDFFYGISWYDQLEEENLHENAMKEHLPDENSSFILFLKLLSSTPYSIFLLIILLIFFGANYGGDFVRGNSLSLIFTQPIDRSEYYKAKWKAGLIRILFLIFSSTLLIILIGFIFGIGGTLNFPIVKYIGFLSNPYKNIDYSNYYKIIPLYRYLLEYGLLFILNVIFFYTLSQIFSLLLKNRWKAHGLLLGLVIILDLIKKYIHKFNIFNPIIYLHIDEIIRGELPFKYGISNIDVKIGACILIFLIIFTYFLGKYISKKQRRII